MQQQPQVAPPAEEPSIGALVQQLSVQIPDLVRSELRLAQAELTQKGKRAGTGLGMFSAAGVVAFLGLGALVAAAILGLAEGVVAWLAALLVGIALLAVAGIVGLIGRSRVSAATPLKPEQSMQSIEQDIATLKGERS